jgi:hypothetical protein
MEGPRINLPAHGAEPVGSRLPSDLLQLDGYFAFLTDLKQTFVTATGGGGHTTDVIHTDATVPRSWEWFRLWIEEGSGLYALQTINGRFVTAVDAGGRTTDTIHSDATAVASWELFAPVRLFDANGDFSGFGLKTTKGYFLTAVGGGGQSSGDTIHTDATVAKSWETFLPYRSSQFGTGSTYGIQIWGGNAPGQADLRGWMFVETGGGAPGPNALWLTDEGELNEISWTLLKQSDGTYALQTANGTVLSAASGFSSDTPLDSISDSEKFTLEDQGDFTVCIKTFNGQYISLGSGIVAGKSNINRALKFRLQLFDLVPGPTG